MNAPELLEIADAVRGIVFDVAPDAEEKKMYGGLVFQTATSSGKELFCGIFISKNHVSLEFSRGAEFDDPAGNLEGSGKKRRHLKLRSTLDIESKLVRYYVQQAVRLASPETA